MCPLRFGVSIRINEFGLGLAIFQILGKLLIELKAKARFFKNGSISKSVGIGSCIDHASSDYRSCKIMEKLEG